MVDSGAVWRDSVNSDDYRTGAGVEIAADVGPFYSSHFKVRLGYAHGFDIGGEDQVYLRVALPTEEIDVRGNPAAVRSALLI